MKTTTTQGISDTPIVSGLLDTAMTYTHESPEHCFLVNAASLVAELIRTTTILIDQHDRPHGFDNQKWYKIELEAARHALLRAKAPVM